MKLLFSQSIDKSKWDALVLSSEDSTVFSLSAYLETVAENWSVIVDDTYRCGMAIPFIERFGKRIAYTPVFFRYAEWFGDALSKQEAIELIKNYFEAGNINFRSEDQNLTAESTLKFQQILPGNWKLNDQGKRMLKRFERSGMIIRANGEIDDVLTHINSELKNKIAGINQRSIQRLDVLASQLKGKGLLEVISVHSGSECVGGIFIVHKKGRSLYLKGTFTAHAKNEGAMYAAMNYAISETITKGHVFDFGGSNATGVRRFNHNLGGSDEYYTKLTWDRLPKWYTIIQRITKWIRK